MSNDPAIQAIYNRVADWFANWVETTFETEDSLKAVWEEHHRTQPFDRTSNWNRVLFNELTKIWKTQGTGVEGATLTGFDRNEILKALADRLDYNLFTQVLMNLQDFGSLQYACSEAEVVTELLKEKWEGRKPSIFDAKPKMFKEAKDDTEAEYNRDLSTLKAMRIIAGYTPNISYRVSPKGSTPALTDSANLSMLGIGGDPYLVRPRGREAFYLTWTTTPNLLRQEGEDSAWVTPRIHYPFYSKSGGDILNSVLWTRQITHELYQLLKGDCFVLPRMSSVLVLADPERVDLLEPYAEVNGIGFYKGAR
jgi:hypothetical protein